MQLIKDNHPKCLNYFLIYPRLLPTLSSAYPFMTSNAFSPLPPQSSTNQPSSNPRILNLYSNEFILRKHSQYSSTISQIYNRTPLSTLAASTYVMGLSL